MSDQPKRVRSPNYPAISLSDAITRMEGLHKRIQKHSAPREAIVKGLGYKGWNGASAIVLSAVVKYGLLDRINEDSYKVSERAMRAMFGKDQVETSGAIREAAFAPALYADLYAEFGEAVPHDDILRPWLIRRGFSQSVVDTVVQSYRDTVALVKLEHSEHDVAQDKDLGELSMQTMTAPTTGHAGVASPPVSAGRQERIMDDDGNSIVLNFPFEPTLETYDFLKDYLEFRITRLKRTTQAKMTNGEN